jgi:catechol 2,3-dioxygenase
MEGKISKSDTDAQPLQSCLPQLTHMGIRVRDLVGMERFYTSVLSMIVTDRGRGNYFKCDIVFMTASPGEHHQLVIAGGRGDEQSTVFQMSFKVQSIDALRRVHDRALKFGATDMRPMNHGNALSIYFFDPERNLVEVYRDTPFHVPQPHADPLDLTKSDEQIWRETEEVCRRDPGFRPIGEFAESNEKQLRW